MTGIGAEPAAVALILVDFDDLSNHFRIFPLFAKALSLSCGQ